MNKEMGKVLAVLKNNPRGMTVTDVAKAVKMNRNSVAKYLEMLVISGRVDMETFGPSKVYFTSRRIPISAMLSVTSDNVVTLSEDLKVIFANDRFLELIGRDRGSVVGLDITSRPVPVLSHPEFLADIREALQGNEVQKEICLQKLHGEYYFNTRLIPTVLEDGERGLTIIFEDVTDRKQAENALVKANEDLERRVTERTAELRRANEALQSEIRERQRYWELSEALNAINMTINSTLDFDDVMRRVVSVSAVTLKCETAIIALRENGGWTVRYTFGIAKDIRGKTQPDHAVPTFEPGTDDFAPVAISDALNDTRMSRQLMERLGIRSTLIVPLALRSEVIGAIFLNYHTAPFMFSRAEIDFARKLGTSVSLSLANARIYEEVASLARESRQRTHD